MSKSVCIIGAGLGGLVLGYRLLKKGYKVDILEKSDKIGGLAAGFEFNGTHLEQAYHHIFKTDTDILELCDELKLDNKLRWLKSSVAIVNQNGLQSFAGPTDLLKFNGLNFFDKLRMGLVTVWLQHDRNYHKYNKMSAAKFMKKYCGVRAYQVIWEPLLRGKFGNDYEKVSMAWLWARIHTRGNSKDKDGEKLGYFDGGFEVLVKKLCDEIKKMDGNIKKKQEIGDNQFTGLRKKYDKIIFTGPNSAFAKLISGQEETEPKYVHELLKTKYLGAICMVFSTKQKLSPYYWHNVNNQDSPFLAMIEHTNLVSAKNYEDEEVYYLGKYMDMQDPKFLASDEKIKEEWFKYLAKIFPEFNSKKVFKKWIFKFKNAQHLVEIGYRPLAYKTPLKNVYLMNFAQIFPEDRGTNFAVAEANKLAKSL